MAARKCILVVDDEKDIVDLVAYNLEREGYEILTAGDGEKALTMIKSGKLDLVILDLMLPGIKGLDICRIIRRHPETDWLPVIMLTAKGEDLDKVVGLEMGADDYITKPFSIRELVARVRAVLRRAETRKSPVPDAPEVFSFRDLHLDYAACAVTVAGKKVEMGPTEYKLLTFFTRHPGRVYSRDQLLDRVWGDETFVEPRTVDVHISRLRGAIEKDKDRPEYILTIRGLGYKFGS
ncbi:MAG: response regulator [Syntrophales bacterium]|nr:response regulator [Syntrophales bacterium]